jgi:putative ABC transport system permease protein
MTRPLLIRLALRLVPGAWRAAIAHDLDEEMRAPASDRTPAWLALHAARAGLRLRAARAADRLRRRRGIRIHIRSLTGGSMVNDLRYGVRMLRRAPGLNAIIILTLALGIGANTAIFSVVNTLLLEPLPYPESDRLVAVTFDNDTPLGMQNWPYPKYTALAAEQRVFASTAAYGETSLTIEIEGQPNRVQTEVVSASYFPMLGVQAAHGRVFLAEEDRHPGEAAMVILSDRLWRRAFNASPGAVGATIGIKDRRYQIVGVMPATFRGQSGTVEMWVPGMMADHAMYKGAATGAFSWWVRVIARLAPGMSREQAQAAMPGLTGRVAELVPAMMPASRRADGTELFKLVPLKETKIDPEVSRTFVLFLLGVGFVLLIACANTANLLLGRAIARQKEFGVRRALGASRLQVLRQVTIESLLLALAGGAAGLFVAVWGLDWLTSEKPWNPVGFWSGYARTFDYFTFTLEPRVLAFALALTLGVGLIFGLFPAWQASRGDVSGALKLQPGSGGGVLRPGAGAGARGALMLVEVAFSLVLLVSAGLMVKSFARASSADLGFEPDGVVTMTLGAGSARPAAYYRGILERVSALPGVESASLSVARPLIPGGYEGPIRLPDVPAAPTAGRPADPRGHTVQGTVNAVTPDFVRTHRLRLIDGRDLTDADREGAPLVGLVSKALAESAWPGDSAVGRRLFGDLASRTVPIEVVGVVDNVTYGVLEDPPANVVYVSAWQVPMRMLAPNGLSVRASTDPAGLVQAIRAQVSAADAAVPVYGVMTLDERARRVTSRYRYSTMLVGAMAGLSLFLAAMGIYGVMAYAVAARTREIGIRMALGARPGDVLRMVVGGGLMLTVAGIGIGLAGAYAASGALRSLLYGVEPSDPVTFAAIAVLMAVIAALASYLPARRAVRVDPVSALRDS